MDGTEEHHSEQGQPGSEDQKSYVLPLMRTLILGQIQKCCWTWVTQVGNQNMKAFDVPTPEELIQKPYSDRRQYEKGIRN
jgi:hypothetical protein